MDSRNHEHAEGSCCDCRAGDSTRQTLSELDFERGIWSAAQSGDLDRVRLLLSRGTAVDAEDNAGYTGLHYAARNNHASVCQELLSRGARVDATTRSGRATALQRAASQGHARIVELLLRAGADPDAQDADGLTALHRALAADQQRVSQLLANCSRSDIEDRSGTTARQLAEKTGRLHWLT